MRIVVTVRKDVTDWASPNEWEQMDDHEVIELVREDIEEFLDGAVWDVRRE